MLYLHPAKQGLETAPPEAEAGRPYGIMPVGVAAIANLLGEQGIRVQGLNYPLEKSLDSSFDLPAWLRARAGARVALIDLHWYEHSYGAISVARACKEALPQTAVVLGGITASTFASEILAQHPAVDYIVRGDAEQPIVELLKRLLAAPNRKAPPKLADIPNLSYRVGADVVENPLGYCAEPMDLDTLNFADIAFLEHYQEYQAHEYIVTDLPKARLALEQGKPYRGRWLCNARGCRHECSYCGGCASAHRTFAGRDQVVARSPARMADDLHRLATQIQQVSLTYDLVELGEVYWRELFDRLTAQKTRIGLYNEVFQLPTTEFIEAFAECADPEHSCLAISPLSGSEAVRRLNGKPYTNASLLHACDVLSRHNVPIFVYFSLNLPGEDDSTISETVDLATRIYDLYPPSLIKILNSCHTLDPLSPMSVHPQRYAVDVTMRTFQDYYNYCYETQFVDQAARTESNRGFRLADAAARKLEAMADRWDAARDGRETSWWPLPPGW